jgi:acyl dehydratase
MKAGDTYTHVFRFSQAEVERFAEVTGDTNPLHLDDAYAAGTVFKQKIMHGFLSAAVFSKVFGTLFPGEGTIYLEQQLQFLRPMFVDTDYTATFTVLEIQAEKNRARIKTEITAPTGKATITGEALVQNPRIG